MKPNETRYKTVKSINTCLKKSGKIHWKRHKTNETADPTKKTKQKAQIRTRNLKKKTNKTKDARRRDTDASAPLVATVRRLLWRQEEERRRKKKKDEEGEEER